MKYQFTALKFLKEYVMLNVDNLIADISDIIEAFAIGCISTNVEIQMLCANAVAFLVENHIVYSRIDYDKEPKTKRSTH